jgi:hypothetical protein
LINQKDSASTTMQRNWNEQGSQSQRARPARRTSFSCMYWYVNVLCLALTLASCQATGVGRKFEHPYKNITIVLNNLLDTYEQTVRPGTEGMHGQYHNDFKYTLLNVVVLQLVY